MRRCNLWKTGIRNILRGSEGNINRGLLLLLILVVAGGGYIYYFTNLFSPDDEGAVNPSQSSLVKIPLPVRPENPASVQDENTAPQQTIAAAGDKTTAAHSEPVVSTEKKAVSSPPASAPQQSKAVPVTSKPSREFANKKPEQKTAPAAEATISKKPTAEGKKSGGIQKHATQGKTAGKTVRQDKGKGKAAYTLQIGVYVTDRSLAAEKAKLRSAGLEPLVSKGPKKTQTMNRLFIGEFSSYAEAAVKLQALRKATPDAFILPEQGKYNLYAGSYFVKERADKELVRLSGVGYSPAIRTSSVPVSTVKLTAGVFETRQAAELKAQSLKKQGIEAAVVKPGSQ